LTTWLEQGGIQNKFGFILVDFNQKTVSFTLVEYNQKNVYFILVACNQKTDWSTSTRRMYHLHW